MSEQKYLIEIGGIIARERTEKGMTQSELAEKIGTSQPAINRIEKGRQNISLDMVEKISQVLKTQILTVNDTNSLSFRVHGGRRLSGEVTLKTSKNAAVALLMASLLNRGRTVLSRVSKIEEVYRITEVLTSIGVKIRWINNKQDLELIPPKEFNLEALDEKAATKTRSIIMLLAPMLHRYNQFSLPYAGGCSLGERSIEPHVLALQPFGLRVDARRTPGRYEVTVDELEQKERRIILIERGDTVTENALMAAALTPSVTVIRNASPNYMVQDLCFFLQDLGVEIQGIGTTTLTIKGKREINKDIKYTPAEDPLEAMFFLTAALATDSEITIRRVPIEFMEIELETLHIMKADIDVSEEYASYNGRTRLVDLVVKPSKLVAPPDKIHPMPFPGINIDNLPFFSLIAACAEGRTLIHDWVYENRAIYITYLSYLGAKVELLDAHRVYVEGPTRWKPTDMTTPPALRPAAVLLLAMLAAPGQSFLRNIYTINRGYEDLASRLNKLGADIEPLTSI